MKQLYLIGTLSLAMLSGCQSISPPGLNNYFRSDASINTEVQAAFYNNSVLQGSPIHVETHDGTVQLDGYVKTIRQSDVAGDLAAKIAGVKGVQNNLIVKKY